MFYIVKFSGRRKNCNSVVLVLCFGFGLNLVNLTWFISALVLLCSWLGSSFKFKLNVLVFVQTLCTSYLSSIPFLLRLDLDLGLVRAVSR